MFKNTSKGITQLAVILIAVFLIFISYVAYRSSIQPKNGASPVPAETGDIKVDYPKPNQETASPLEISGQARGSWFFEAVFPVKLVGEDGGVIAQGQARASGNWMTDDFVMFDATLNFSVTQKRNAVLIFQNDNPSGLSENAKEFRIPVALLPNQGQVDFSETGNLIQPNPAAGSWTLSYEKAGSSGLTAQLIFSDNSVCKAAETAVCVPSGFKDGQKVRVEGLTIGTAVLVFVLTAQEEPAAQKQIYFYYYNSSKDLDASGNIFCSRKGLVPVLREINATLTPIQDAVNLLIAGNLTEAEKQQGITTEFPLAGFSLKGVALNNGILALEFDDPNNKTGGGSCRAGILWYQIEATAKQFEGVKEVRFIPDTLFQP